MNPRQTREDQLMAAFCHAAALLSFFGAIISLLVWLVTGSRSQTLRFQAAQALALQVLRLAISSAAMALYFGGIVFFVFGSVALTGGAMDDPIPPLGIAGFLVTVGFLLFAMFIVSPAIILVELIVAARVLKNAGFRVPLLGQWVARMLEKYRPVLC